MSEKKQLSESEVDRIIISQAEDDSAWEEPIAVKVAMDTPFTLPPELAARAAFFAQLHQKENVGEWLTSIIRERLDFEEAAFTSLQRVMEQRAVYHTTKAQS